MTGGGGGGGVEERPKKVPGGSDRLIKQGRSLLNHSWTRLIRQTKPRSRETLDAGRVRSGHCAVLQPVDVGQLAARKARMGRRITRRGRVLMARTAGALGGVEFQVSFNCEVMGCPRKQTVAGQSSLPKLSRLETRDPAIR